MTQSLPREGTETLWEDICPDGIRGRRNPYPLRGRKPVVDNYHSKRATTQSLPPHGDGNSLIYTISFIWSKMCSPLLRPALSEAGSAEREADQVRFCSLKNAMPSDAGMQYFEVSLPAQPVGRFWVRMAVRGGGPLVLGKLAAPPVNSSPSAFSFVPCPARFLFGKTKRKCGGHSDGQSPSCSAYSKAVYVYMLIF